MTILPIEELNDLSHELEKRIDGEVHVDPYTRILYSTDASNYQIEPLGVVFPRHADDLSAIVEIAAKRRIPILARGAGTSLSGQAVGPGLVIDCARHLNRILTIDPERHLAVVEPGVVGAALNAAAGRHGLMFGPDPASADRATVGGIVGNNATGAHSIRYGMTADHLLAADVVFDDGSCGTLARLPEAEALRLVGASETRLARVLRAMLAIRAKYAQVVGDRWPRVWRRASGYSLDYLVGHHPLRPAGWYADPDPYPGADGIHFPALLCGSEGTLAILRQATLNLVPKPATTVLCVLTFDSIDAACDATPAILESHPAAVELVPRALIDRARTIPHYARKARFLPAEARTFLVIEYSGASSSEALAGARSWAKRGLVVDSPQAQEELWEVRKAGLGLLLSVSGDTKPVSFIEDVVVQAERLAEYVRRVNGLLAEQGTQGEWYAHASAGCLHMRPMINLKTAHGVRQMRAITEGVLEIVLEMGGVLSGEHGDGLAHTEFNPHLFGPELTAAFRELKRAFDPAGVLNPGKVVVMEGEEPPSVDSSLRYGPDYRAPLVNTVYAFRREGGLARAIEDCNGAGVCLQSGGVMCPSYQATRDEMHTTRGRANALRAALSGRLPPGALTSREMYQVLDLCLQCKGCKAECPSGVDMARIKGEFLELYYAEHGVPLRSRLFGEIAMASKWVRPMAGLANAVVGLGITRKFLESTLGISRHRRLPRFARRTFRHWLSSRNPSEAGEPIVLFVDTFTNYNHPEIGQAAVRVLEAAGCRVILAQGQACCGRAMISKGLLRRAKQQARRNLEALEPYLSRGTPIVGIEPSCVSTLRDETLEFYPDDPRAAALAESAQLIEEFLMSNGPDGRRRIDHVHLRPTGERLLVHGHCQAKALVGTAPTLNLLRATGSEVQEIDSGCCGMAGSFGYEVEHYELSMRIGEMRLFPAVRAGAEQGARIVAAGSSCRAQILDGTGIRAWHPIEVVAQCLHPD
ncbi:MAG: FAD-linked oxidase C-terminal domain-containing protein [Chloroflexota bacterium]